MTSNAQMHAPPFFVVGSARSGTTYLRLILNAHPEVAVPFESRFITTLKPASGEVEVDAFLSALAADRRFQGWHLDVADIKRSIGTQERIPYPVAIEKTYEAYAAKHGKVRWGDKTPRYVEKVHELATMFPDARFVHLVRDGRNVALSYAKTDFGPRTVAKAADVWRRRVSAGLRDGRPLGPKRYLEVRYEELVDGPEETVRTICGFLDLEFDPRMFDEEERTKGLTERARKNNPYVAGKTIPKTRSWQQDMAPSQVEVFEAVGGTVLSELGYERRYPAPSLAARVKARLGLWGLPIGHLDANSP